MSVNVSRTTTVRALAVERQLISCEGVTRRVVRIPDYQVKLGPDGAWHRRGAIETETACGAASTDSQALRAYLLDDELCEDGCFSPHELRLGHAHAQQVETSRFDLTDADES